MKELILALRERAAQCKRTTAHDNPNHYLHVVAKETQKDGELLSKAADALSSFIFGQHRD